MDNLKKKRHRQRQISAAAKLQWPKCWLGRELTKMAGFPMDVIWVPDAPEWALYAPRCALEGVVSPLHLARERTPCETRPRRKST